MAFKLFKDMGLALDNAAGTLTAITAQVNQASLQGIQDLLEDSVLSSEEKSYLPGLAGATVPLNGFLNSTVDDILGPLIGNRTSITKTIEYYNGLKYYNGEVYLNDVQYSGSVNTIQTWSANATFDGAVTRTSVTLVA